MARHDEASGGGRLRELVTPEGVALRLKLGEASERLGALALDLAIMVAALIAMTAIAIAAAVGARQQGLEPIAVIWLLGFFLLRNFYFVYFESRPAAATPGKRLLGLRVAARNGERLAADAVFARNAMREIEVFLPLTFMGVQAASGVDAWIILAGAAWCAVFVAFPLFNRDRLRAGDLIAGTWVVKAPKPILLPDLTDEAPSAAADPRFAFGREHLTVYGERELHVLEEVLRRADGAALEEVAQRIRGKIGWSRGPGEADEAFLRAYYVALRGRLEAGLLLGRRRKDKHDRTV